jgi:hypothetical protein
MGSAGFVCTPRMSALIAQAGNGVLPSDEGGQDLRDLYQDGQSFFLYFFLCGSAHAILLQTASAGWNPHLLDGFAFKCHIGDLEGVKKVRILLLYLPFKNSMTSTRLWRLDKRLR